MFSIKDKTDIQPDLTPLEGPFPNGKERVNVHVKLKY